jgi:hypothetical protein
LLANEVGVELIDGKHNLHKQLAKYHISVWWIISRCTTCNSPPTSGSACSCTATASNLHTAASNPECTCLGDKSGFSYARRRRWQQHRPLPPTVIV